MFNPMSLSNAKRNNREKDFAWCYVTVQVKENECKDAEPGYGGPPSGKCT